MAWDNDRKFETMSKVTLEETKNNYLCSLYFEGGRVGVSFADISTGEICATTFDDEETRVLNELGTYAPREIITNLDREDSQYLRDFAKDRLGALCECDMGAYFDFASSTARVYKCWLQRWIS